jgi:hypothetical protein
MKRLIHKYLTEYFFIKGDFVYSLNKIPKSAQWLTDELEEIFGLTKKELKWYVKSWCRRHRSGFNFKRYWNSTWGTMYGRLGSGYVYAPYIPLGMIGMAQARAIMGTDPVENPISGRYYGWAMMCGTTVQAPDSIVHVVA